MVVEVEHRVDRAQVHVRLEVGVDRADLAPVALVASVGAGHLVLQEVVDVRGAVPDQPRDDVAAHAVPAVLVGRVLAQRLDQHGGVEDVGAHGHERLVRRAVQAGRVGGLFLERLDAAAVGRGPDHAEVRGGGAGHRDRGHGDPGVPVQVGLDHLVRVHPVHVIGPGHQHQVGPVTLDEGQRLVDGVGRAGLPARAEPLLGRHRRHVVVQQAAQPPGGGDVPVQAVALVLGEHADALYPAVDQVGQGEVHHPVDAAERDGRLGPVRGQRPQPAAGPARQDDAQDPLPGHRPLTPVFRPADDAASSRSTSSRCSSQSRSGRCRWKVWKCSGMCSASSFQACGVHGEQQRQVRPGDVQAVEVERAGGGQRPIGVETASASPDSRSMIHFSTRMFSPKPGQTNRPRGVLAEPVHVEQLRQLARVGGDLADLQPVAEVVAHVVPAERQHRERVVPQLAHRALGRGGLLRGDVRAEEHPVIPAERLDHQRHRRRPPAAEQDRRDRHPGRVVPLRRDDRALGRGRGEPGVRVRRRLRRIRASSPGPSSRSGAPAARRSGPPTTRRRRRSAPRW